MSSMPTYFFLCPVSQQNMITSRLQYFSPKSHTHPSPKIADLQPSRVPFLVGERDPKVAGLAVVDLPEPDEAGAEPFHDVLGLHRSWASAFWTASSRIFRL